VILREDEYFLDNISLRWQTDAQVMEKA